MRLHHDIVAHEIRGAISQYQPFDVGPVTSRPGACQETRTGCYARQHCCREIPNFEAPLQLSFYKLCLQSEALETYIILSIVPTSNKFHPLKPTARRKGELGLSALPPKDPAHDQRLRRSHISAITSLSRAIRVTCFGLFTFTSLINCSCGSYNPELQESPAFLLHTTQHLLNPVVDCLRTPLVVRWWYSLVLDIGLILLKQS